MKMFLAFFLVIACLSPFPVGAQSALSAKAAPDTLITLQRGACEGRCAVYRLVIFADGTVIYEGRHFVRRAGLVKSGVSPEVLAKLIDELTAGGFFELANDYGYRNKDRCESMDSDGPLTILTVSSGGRSKTVLHHHRCTGPESKRVTELEDKVDRAVGAAKWIQ